jgi:hypothetical protein
MARQAGTTVEAALKSYTELDKLLHTDKIKGLEAIFERIGVSPRDYAAHVLNQSPDQQASQSDATIRELRQEIAGLKQQIGGVTQTIQQQREAEQQRLLDENAKQVAEWSKDKPLFDILAPHIVTEFQNGATGLDDAYQRVLQKHPQLAAFSPPETANATAASSAASKPDEAQTLKGQKSINGAPTAGLTSTSRKRVALSLDDALDKAFGAVG